MAASKYFTGKPCKRGHLAERFVNGGICVECNREKAAAFRKSNPLRAREFVKNAYAKHGHTYVEGHRKANKAYRAANPKDPEKVRADNSRNYARLGRKYWNAARAKRRATEKRQMPLWADQKAIEAIYKTCPDGHHVDHVIPLRGRLVSGLHVESNLQYLPAGANRRKSNVFELEV